MNISCECYKKNAILASDCRSCRVNTVLFTTSSLFDVVCFDLCSSGNKGLSFQILKMLEIAV